MQASHLQHAASRRLQLCCKNARSVQVSAVSTSRPPMRSSKLHKSYPSTWSVAPNGTDICLMTASLAKLHNLTRETSTAAFQKSIYSPRFHRKPALAASAAHHVYEGHLAAHPTARFGIVIGRFNDLVTKLLLEGALGTFQRHGVDADNIDVAWVPGSFELPVVAKTMAETGKYDAIVCIGVVVRGATTHYDAVVSGATSGVLNASVATGVPVIFGVLTCDTMEQALDRAGGKVGNKGGEAAATAVEMGNLMRKLREDGKAK